MIVVKMKDIPHFRAAGGKFPFVVGDQVDVTLFDYIILKVSGDNVTLEKAGYRSVNND